MSQNHDYGVYQVYGPSPVYGRQELLYIGLASNQTFGVRIKQHRHWFECTRDDSQVVIYVGRLMGASTPENHVWSKEIKLAEGILIYAHYPCYNKQKDGVASDPEFRRVHVHNLGRYRDLFPEVSGKHLDIAPPMKPYGAEL